MLGKCGDQISSIGELIICYREGGADPVYDNNPAGPLRGRAVADTTLADLGNAGDGGAEGKSLGV